MKTHKLILVDTEAELVKASSVYPTLPTDPKSEVFLYSESEEIRLKAKEIGFQTREEKDVLSVARLKQANEEAFELSRKWHTTPSIVANFNCRGILLARLIEKDFSYYLIRLIRRLLVIDGIIKKEHIDEIVIFGGDSTKPESVRWQPKEKLLSAVGRYLAQIYSLRLQVLPKHCDEKEQLSKRRQRLKKRLASIGRVFSSLALLFLKPFIWCAENKTEKELSVLFSGNPTLLYPVIQEASQNTYLNIHPLYFNELLGPKIIQKLLKDRVGPLSILNGLSLSAIKDFLKLKWSGVVKFNFAKLQKELNPFFQVDSLPLLPLVQKRMELFFKHIFPKLAFYIACTERVLAKSKVTAILVDEDVSEHKRALVLIAKQLGIRSTVFMHGVPARRIGYAPLSADFMAIWGDVYRSCLKNWEIDEQQLLVTGNPRYDGLLRQDCREQVLEKVHTISEELGSARPILLALNMYRESWKQCFYGESYSHLEMEETILRVCHVLSAYPNVYLIIKLHPRDQNPESYEAMLAKAKKMYPQLKALVNQKSDIFGLIQLSKIVLTIGSSVAVDALWIEKPVLLLDFLNHEENYSYFDSSVIPRIKTEEALKQELSVFFAAPEQYAKQHTNPELFFYKRDGKSALRLLQAVIGR